MEKDCELYAQLIEKTPIGIVAATPEGVIHYINSYAGQLFNIASENMINHKIDAYLSVCRNGCVWEELWKQVVEGIVTETTLVIQPADREDIMCKVTFFGAGDSPEHPDFIALIFRDITHEIQFNNQIDQKNIEMAKMNTELIRWNAELKRVSELKSNFLSIASHELKTPLTSIKGYSDIIIDNMKDKIDSGVYRMIESINRAADRLHKVVNSILDVTRIEQKRLRLKPEMLDIGIVVKDSIEDLAQFSQKRGIVFNYKYSPALPQFYGDKMRTLQVFTNLFSNAIKYSPDGSSVDVSIELENNNQFHITVTDHGVGIDQDEQKNIFDAFYEIGNANRHHTDFSKFMGGGTGLGLSIVKGIVERHGGKIWVESTGVRENEFPGSVFHIVLPMHAEIGWDDDETKTLVVEHPDDDAVDLEEFTERINRKPIILFIDSDREAVEIARMVLENAFEVLVAETGEAGLTLAFTRAPSVILMDSYLPTLDGYRVCRILRTQDETRNTPIAFFSAGTQHSEIQKCFACGADDFIVKPFSGRELVDKIWRLLMKKKEENTFK
jgi:signal transduction histidine kinase/ActR/RegA family two-component response regulator